MQSSTKPAIAIPPDPRWQHMVGGYDDLARVPQDWTALGDVPPEVAQMLATARDLFVHCYFVYDFATVALVYGFMGLEAALRDRLPEARESTPLMRLVDRAIESGLLTGQEGDQLKAGVQFRNRLIHPRQHAVLTPAMAAQMLKVTFAFVARFYSEAKPPSEAG